MSLGQQPNKLPLHTFNPQGFEQLIREMGVRLIHQRAISSPRVKSLRGDDFDVSDNKQENGYIYYGSKEFIGAFQGNTMERQYNVNGTFDDDSASIVIPTKYSDGTDMDVSVFDRIIAPDMKAVRYPQRVEHNMSGNDRLHFPAESVDLLIDSRGTQYTEKVDFRVDERGMIEWLPGGRRPMFDPVLNKGEIYSISYYMKPVFTVVGLPHQFRITQTKGPDGRNIQHRFPQLSIVRKDFIPADPNDTIGSKYADEPQRNTIRGGNK